MIRNKFIAAEQSCELRRHLDGVSSDASIQDIVNNCRVSESHTEAANRCVNSIGHVRRSQETVIADAGSVATEGDS